jgi:hypothetical protein
LVRYFAEHSLDRQRANDERPNPEELLLRYDLQDEKQESSFAAPSTTVGAAEDCHVNRNKPGFFISFFRGYTMQGREG